jgi:hypothetical protein
VIETRRFPDNYPLLKDHEEEKTYDFWEFVESVDAWEKSKSKVLCDKPGESVPTEGIGLAEYAGLRYVVGTPGKQS